MIPVAHLDVSGKDMRVLCPYCNARMDPCRISTYPVADPEVEYLDADKMSWESRCPNCGGDFSLTGGVPEYRNERQSATTDRQLIELMISLEAAEAAVSTMMTTYSERMRPPVGPVMGRNGGLRCALR